MSHEKDLRKGRFSCQGYTYLVTTTTYQRTSIFEDFYLSRALIQELHYSDNIKLTQTIGYVVMPDHLHWLFNLGDHQSLSNVIKKVKGRSALAINNLANKKGRLWQQGFHDRCMRQDDNLINAMRYIVANPLRAGLVNSVKQYPHWDCIYINQDKNTIPE